MQRSVSEEEKLRRLSDKDASIQAIITQIAEIHSQYE